MRTRELYLRLLPLLIALSSASGCATAHCDAEAQQTTLKDDARAYADAKEKCEKRVAGMRRSLKEQQEERERQERRDAFVNRNEGRPR